MSARTAIVSLHSRKLMCSLGIALFSTLSYHSNRIFTATHSCTLHRTAVCVSRPPPSSWASRCAKSAFRVLSSFHGAGRD
eukprot:6436277-Prymnesium_polylepis.1